MGEQRGRTKQHDNKKAHGQLRVACGGGLQSLLLWGGALAVSGLVAYLTMNKVKSSQHKNEDKQKGHERCSRGLLTAVQPTLQHDQCCCAKCAVSKLGMTKKSDEEETQSIIYGIDDDGVVSDFSSGKPETIIKDGVREDYLMEVIGVDTDKEVKDTENMDVQVQDISLEADKPEYNHNFVLVGENEDNEEGEEEQVIQQHRNEEECEELNSSQDPASDDEEQAEKKENVEEHSGSRENLENSSLSQESGGNAMTWRLTIIEEHANDSNVEHGGVEEKGKEQLQELSNEEICEGLSLSLEPVDNDGQLEDKEGREQDQEQVKEQDSNGEKPEEQRLSQESGEDEEHSSNEVKFEEQSLSQVSAAISQSVVKGIQVKQETEKLEYCKQSINNHRINSYGSDGDKNHKDIMKFTHEKQQHLSMEKHSPYSMKWEPNTRPLKWKIPIWPLLVLCIIITAVLMLTLLGTCSFE